MCKANQKIIKICEASFFSKHFKPIRMQDNKNAATFWITAERMRMQESRSWPRQTNKMTEARHNASKHYLLHLSVCPRGVPGAGWGVSAPGGGAWSGGCLLQGECLVLGVPAPEGVPAPRGVGCLVWGVPGPVGGVFSWGPGLGGAWSWGDSWSRGGGIPACTEADSPQQTNTVADGTHPTGMHSCLIYLQNNIPVFSPGLTDGSIGDMIYFHSYKNPGLILDIVEGEKYYGIFTLLGFGNGTRTRINGI